MKWDLNTVQLLMSSKGKCRIFSFGNQLISEGCTSCLGGCLTELFGALTNSTSSSPNPCMTVHWMLSLSFPSQVTWPGTQPSSTRFPATRRPCGPSRALLESLGGRAPREPLVSKDPPGPRASPEMPVCRARQESEVSGPCLSLGVLTWGSRGAHAGTAFQRATLNRFCPTCSPASRVCPNTERVRSYSMFIDEACMQKEDQTPDSPLRSF